MDFRNKRKVDIKERTTWLRERAFDYILVLDFVNLCLLDSYGTVEYAITLHGKLFNLDKPGRSLWKYTVKTLKNPDRPTQRLQFDTEMKKTTEEIRISFRQEAAYVIETVANNLK